MHGLQDVSLRNDKKSSLSSASICVPHPFFELLPQQVVVSLHLPLCLIYLVLEISGFQICPPDVGRH